jgi:anti-sigma factor ChrR (cupin superfamily)
MNSPNSELAALHALGSLDTQESQQAAALLASDPDFATEVLAFQEVVASLADLLPLPAPPAAVRDKVLRQTLPNGLEALVKTGAVPWKVSPFQGVSAKRLFRDPAGNITWLVKLDAGATYPRHRHSAYEHCLVLEGEVQFDEYTLRAGDYEVAGPDTDHSAFRSERGAVLFIIANQHDEVFQ